MSSLFAGRVPAVLIAVASLGLCYGSAVAADWGTLSGQIVFDGTPPKPEELNITTDKELCGKVPQFSEELVVGPGGGIKNVLIYCRERRVKTHPDLEKPPTEPLVLDNVVCRFEPRVLPLLVDHEILLRNSDPKAHNINLQPIGDVGVNPILAPGQELKHKFRRAQRIPVPVACNIHPWMQGYVFPSDNPYFAVTDEEGKFTIENLPVGVELEFQAWQEKSGYLEAPGWEKGRFTIKLDGETKDLGTVKVPAASFKK